MPGSSLSGFSPTRQIRDIYGLSFSFKEYIIDFEMAIFHTGGVFSYLPHHLDLALEDSVGHSTCMSVLARRRAIMGWLMG